MKIRYVLSAENLLEKLYPTKKYYRLLLYGVVGSSFLSSVFCFLHVMID